MCATSAVGINDDLAACETCVTVRSADNELSGRVYMENEIIMEEGCCLLWKGCNHFREKNLTDILFNLVMHGLVNSCLTELADCVIVRHLSELRSYKLIMLCRYYYSMDADRMIGFIVLDCEL